MQVLINGRETTLDGVETVADLIRRCDFQGRVAVEINRELITHGRFSTHRLREGDAIEIVRAIGGG